MMRFRTFAAALWLVTSPSFAAEPQVAERWAVLVGVDDYANANDLQFCGADQRAFRDRLVAAGFRPENVVLLHDQAAENKYRPSQRHIEDQLRLTIGNAEADDLVVVGFSGHGVSLGGKSYLCPSDARLNDPTTLIALDGIYDQLRQCSARFKWVLVDACRNDPTLGGGRSFTATEGTKQLARSLQELKLPEGVVLMNSCAPEEISWEEQTFGHGVYMHYVLEAMSGAGDADDDGHVSLNELQRYASGRTRSYVSGKFNVTQRPFSRSEGEADAMDFPLISAKPDFLQPYAKENDGAQLHPADKSQGRASRPYLGVGLDSKFDDQAARRLGLPRKAGARVSEVFPATPADGTILLDDVVLRFDGVNVQDNRHLIELINRTKLGVAIPLVVFRKQGFVNVSTKLGDLDAVLAK